MTLVASQPLNDQINTLRRQSYNAVSPQEKEHRAEKRRAYSQARRDYAIQHKSFVCYSCFDKSGEYLCFSGNLELTRHLRTNRHLRSALPLVADTECLRMLESKVEDPTAETNPTIDVEYTSDDI